MFVTKQTVLKGRFGPRIMTILAAGLILSVVAAGLEGAPGVTAHPVRTATGVPSSGTPSASDSSGLAASAVETGASTLAQNALALTSANHVPSRYVYVPRSGPSPLPPAATGGHVVSGYSSAPAPMGVAYFGLLNSSGKLVPTFTNTTSLRGTFVANTSQGLQPMYMDDGAPDAFGIQLNAVLTNVTLGGHESTGRNVNQFWTQNVVQYSAQLHLLQFVDNVWDFWPGYTQTTILAHGPNGTFVYPDVYYAIGPEVHIQYPFSLTLYLNSTVVGGDNAVYFNYTLSNSTATVSGSYDFVVFNSGGTANPGSAEYQANGYRYDPEGVPNDFEFDVGGPGGGSTTDLVAADATLGLTYWDAAANAYDPVPSAYDVGGETGETSSGAAVWYSGTTAHLSSGPSVVTGLWNLPRADSEPAGFGEVHLRVTPSNAFVFLGPAADGGTLAAPSPSLQWTPLVGPSQPDAGWLSGILALAPGKYTATVMESDYDAVQTTLTVRSGESSVFAATLTKDASAGIYTPLFAWEDRQLAGISSGGTGTASDPYQLIDNRAPGQLLNSLFGTFNDYGFFTFAGLELLGTTASVVATPPSFNAPAPSWLVNATIDREIPSLLGLASWVIDSQHVAIVNATFTGVWFPLHISYADPADLMVFQSEHVLIANNSFQVSGGTGLFVYDQTDFGVGTVTVWGNTFVGNDTVATHGCQSFCFGMILPDSGFQLMGNGQLVYNNAFLLSQTAWTPTTDYWSLLTSPNVTYSDRWNVTPQPATNVRHAAGFPWFPLTGSIAGTDQQGGNWWQNYGSPADPFGDLPYNAVGNITVGGDYDPLVPFALYAVSVTTAAPTNDTWVVQVGSLSEYGWNFAGTAVATSTSDLPNGTYTANGYLVIPGMPVENPGAQLAASASFVVNGSSVSVTLQFEPDYLVVFQPYGYDVNGTPWGICVVDTPWGGGPSPYTYSGGTLWAAIPNGTFNYTSYVIDFNSWSLSGPGCASVPLQSVTVAAPVGTITVDGSDEIIPVEFNETFPVSFYAPGVPRYDEWQVNDTPYPGVRGGGSGPMVMNLINGTYTRGFASLDPSLLPFEGGRWSNVSFVVQGAPLKVKLHFRVGNPVLFDAVGLGNGGYLWGVELRTTNYSTYARSVTGYVPNGTFEYTVIGPYAAYQPLAPYVPVHPTGTVTVTDGLPVTIDVRFAREYPVWFNETGLPGRSTWTVDWNGTKYTASGPSIEILATNGSYFFELGSGGGYLGDPAFGGVWVHGVRVTVPVAFSRGFDGSPTVRMSLVALARGSGSTSLLLPTAKRHA